MKAFTKIALAAAIAISPTVQADWNFDNWSPFNSNNNSAWNDFNQGNFMGDMFGDMASEMDMDVTMNFKFKGKGKANGSGNGNGAYQAQNMMNNGYYNAYNNGYAPYYPQPVQQAQQAGTYQIPMMPMYTPMPASPNTMIAPVPMAYYNNGRPSAQ